MATKVIGNEESRNKAGIARESMREVIGSQLIREVTFK